MERQSIILFDGVCNLCNSSVTFIIDRDRKEMFQFASLQSDVGQALLAKHGLPAQEFGSFVLIEQDRAFTKSTAALRIARELGGWWRILYGFIVVPRPLRDVVYSFVARNRYRWFGQSDTCRIPTPDLQRRFLS